MDHSDEIKAYEDYARAKGADVRTDKLGTMAEQMEEGVCCFSFLHKNARVKTYGTRCCSLIRESDQKPASDFGKGVAEYARNGRFLYYDLVEQAWKMFDAANLIAAFGYKEMDFLAKHLVHVLTDADSRAAKLSLLCSAELRMETEICVLKVTDVFVQGCHRNIYGTRNPFIIKEINPDCLDDMARKEIRARSAEGKFGCFNMATKTWENTYAMGVESMEDYDE